MQAPIESVRLRLSMKSLKQVFAIAFHGGYCILGGFLSALVRFFLNSVPQTALFFIVVAAFVNHARARPLLVDFDRTQPGAYTKDRARGDWLGLRWGHFDRATIVAGANALGAGNGRSMKVFYPKDQVGSSGSGCQFQVGLAPRPEYFLDYRVRFGDADKKRWDFGRGGKLPGLAGGTANTGGKKPTGGGWSARYMWKRGKLVVYLYHLGQKGTNGETLALNQSLVAGKWYRLTQRVRVNNDSVADGVLQVWVDGKLKLDRRDIRFRKGNLAPVDVFYFSTFFGGSSKGWAPKIDSEAFFDQFLIQHTAPRDIQLP
jgi:hypothetical protein